MKCTHLEDFLANKRDELPQWARVQWPAATLKSAIAILVTWDLVGVLAGLFGNIAERSMPTVTYSGAAYLSVGVIVMVLFEHASKESIRRRESVSCLERMVRDGHIECVQCAYAYRDRGGAS